MNTEKVEGPGWDTFETEESDEEEYELPEKQPGM